MAPHDPGDGSPRDPGLLVWDGDCGFCAWSLRVLLRLGATCEHAPWQSLDLARLGLGEDEVRRAAWHVDGTGAREGHAAVAAALATRRRRPVRLLGRLLGSRAAAPAAGPAYRWVARHRGRLPYPGRSG